jgi:hypothetical protein
MSRFVSTRCTEARKAEFLTQYRRVPVFLKQTRVRGYLMRRIAILCASALLAAGPVSAQEWAEYENVRDGFHALFPGEPRVVETTWKSQTGFTLPARVYSVTKGQERYSMTVADYTGVEQLGAERVKTCAAGSETCLGTPGLSGVGYWKHDTRGAPLYAASQFVKRSAKVTEMYWNQQDLVSGIVLQLTNNADESRTYAYIAMHEMKLYIAEATVPKGLPEPALFVQAVGWLDKEGRHIRYRTVYSHEIHGMKEAPVPAH